MTYAYTPKQVEASAQRVSPPPVKLGPVSYTPIKPVGISRHYNGELLNNLLQTYMVRRFNNAADRFLEETKITSSPTMISRKPSFSDIVVMGDYATKQILRRLAGGEVKLAWIVALRVLTGANPIPQSSTGIIKEMGEHWVQWGLDQGILQRL